MRVLIICLVILLGSPACFAKAYHAGKEEMIQKAECIVVVNITAVEEAEKKGNVWTYGQKATAKVELCLKGDVEDTVEIYGQENFICAQCEYKEGRFILFLRRDGDFWVGSNWSIGIRPVKDDNVEWFKKGGTRLEMVEMPLEEVIRDIKGTVAVQTTKSPDGKADNDK